MFWEITLNVSTEPFGLQGKHIIFCNMCFPHNVNYLLSYHMTAIELLLLIKSEYVEWNNWDWGLLGGGDVEA